MSGLEGLDLELGDLGEVRTGTAADGVVWVLDMGEFELLLDLK